ncbi:MAG TPA: coenzyme F420-0:L-glutamate ligase [Candidatus Nitrosocosmicus sp.]|nr:coenzyme F420-0:L-glutamate ligase [Candidatus Nitrosocosmicus sp.]
MKIIPINLEKQFSEFDIFEAILNNKNGITIEDHDILVISSKFLSISEGRVKKLRSIVPSKYAVKKADEYHMNPKIMELILRESDEVYGGLYGFVLSSIHKVLAPNAGIDKSNIPNGKVVLYPKYPLESIETLRNKFLVNLRKRVGIILSDSRILPMRKGTVGIALATCGIDPVIDLKGSKDLFGNTLKYTSQNIADCLASIGTMVMGESDASTPVIILRGFDVKLNNAQKSNDSLAIDRKFDIYIRGLSGNF